MNEPYLFEKSIGQQMGDLCRLAVGDAKVTQAGDIVTLDDMPGRGAFGVSVEVPYTSGGVQTVSVTRCGKNLLNWQLPTSNFTDSVFTLGINGITTLKISGILSAPSNPSVAFIRYILNGNRGYSGWGDASIPLVHTFNGKLSSITIVNWGETRGTIEEAQLELGDTATAYEPYNGDTYTITLPTTIYGGTVDLEAGTVTSRYAADGTELAEPVVTEIDPISIPILEGVNNVWADVGTVTVSYYAAVAETIRPALWYPTIYRGLTSARYLIKRASGAIASFDDAVAAPLVGLRVALPWRSEGCQSVSVTVNGTLTTITLPTTIYGGYLDVVTGQLVATHDADGSLLTNQKLYFLDPVNVSALAGVNNIWSAAGDVAVSYRIDNG